MKNRVFEGTWKEILTHAADLAGRRVRVEVLDAPQTDLEEKPSLAEMLKGHIGTISLENAPPDLSKRTGHYFTEIVVEKHDRISKEFYKRWENAKKSEL